MKVLVTGGSGFIGSAVCRLFVGEMGVSVLNLDKLTYAANLTSLQAIDGEAHGALEVPGSGIYELAAHERHGAHAVMGMASSWPNDFSDSSDDFHVSATRAANDGLAAGTNGFTSITRRVTVDNSV